MNLEATRLRGRPRNRWQDEVREDGRLVGGKGCITERNRRSSWERQGIVTFCTCQWNEWTYQLRTRHLIVIGVYDRWTVRHSKLCSAAFIVCATGFGLSVSHHRAQVKVFERTLIYTTFLNENDRSQSYKCHKMLEEQLPLCMSSEYLCDTKWQLLVYNTWEGYMSILNSLFSIKHASTDGVEKNLICSIIYVVQFGSFVFDSL
jgi:hypothetical protein